MTREVAYALAAVLALLPSTGWAATTTLVASNDNSIYANNVDNSNGGGAGIFSGTNGSGTASRGLIRFDIAGIVPAGSIITGVQLRMYLGMAPNGNPQNIELHKLMKDWGEGIAGSSNPAIMMSGTGYPAGAGDATWNEAMFGSTGWSIPGATGDFIQTASATTTVSGPIDTAFTWNSTSATIGDVQSWLNASGSNYGWALVNADEVTSRTQKVFYSRNVAQNSSAVPNSLDPSWRPTLIVDYTSPAIPTGDYNGNGVVDAADYIVWRKNFGQPAFPAGNGADGNQSGEIDSGDFGYWRAHFGNVLNSPAFTANVPEHSTCALCAVASLLVLLVRKR